MKLCFPGVPFEEDIASGFFSLPNESTIWIGGLDDKEQLRRSSVKNMRRSSPMNARRSLFVDRCRQDPPSPGRHGAAGEGFWARLGGSRKAIFNCMTALLLRRQFTCRPLRASMTLRR